MQSIKPIKFINSGNVAKRFSSVYITGVHTKELGGKQLILDPGTNQGMGFDLKTRQMLGMHGLLPPKVMTQEEQLQRTWGNYDKLKTNIERYGFLQDLCNRNEKLFYKMLMSNIKKLMPIVYTPTVGEACIHYGEIFVRPKGIWISINDKGYIRQILQNWPEKQIKAIVVTDGERILGLGDLGSYGMGIPVGKLALYTACAGLRPSACLPVCIDVGTDNDSLLEDRNYIGLKQKRVRGQEYDDLIQEFMDAVRDIYGRLCLVQFEDFGNHNAFKFLKKFRNKYCMFNDDIQGTAACAISGLIAAERITKVPTCHQKFLFLGAGEAGMGIAGLLQQLLRDEGVKDVMNQISFFDAEGLICSSRSGTLEPDHERFAHDMPHTDSLAEAVRIVQPTVLIGVAGAGPLFTEEVLTEMGKVTENPIIFALSNPTSKAECTAYDAYKYTQGRCIYATGSPQDPVVSEWGENSGKTLIPGQGNNVYIFPGVAMACVLSGVRHIPQRVFLVAAKAVAKEVSAEEIENGQVYPDLNRIRDVNVKVAAAVMDYVYSASTTESIASFLPEPINKEKHIRKRMYNTDYPNLLPSIYDWPNEDCEKNDEINEECMDSKKNLNHD